MGTLIGHILPGTFFITFALWWLYSILKRYYQRNRNPDGFKSSAMFTSSCAPRVPIEAIIKVVATSIGIVGEFVTGFDGNGKFTHMGNTQHISMYFFFGLTGIIDLMYFYKVNILPNLDYASAFIAFCIEGFLFANHLHGRTPLDVMIHTYLLYLILGGAICVLMEAKYRDNVVLPLGRSYFTILQGTWFYQVGFILYPPSEKWPQWNGEDHDHMMFATTVLTWHFAVVGVFVILCMILASKVFKGDGPGRFDIQYQKISMEHMPNGHSSHSLTSDKTKLRQAFNESSEDEI